MSSGERWRRALLLAFPRSHRLVHGEELLAVLAESAFMQPRWTERLRDDVDLVAGGLQIRAYRAGQRGWGDAAAVAAVVLAALMCIAATNGLLLLVIGDLGPDVGFWSAAFATAPLAIWPWIVLLGLAGLRRTPAALAWASALVPAGAAPLFAARLDGAWLVLGFVTAAMLTASPGIARGHQVLGHRRLFAVLLGAALLCTTQGLASLAGHVDLPVALTVVDQQSWAWTCFCAGLGLLTGALMPGRRGSPAVRRSQALVVVPGVVALMTLFDEMAAFHPQMETAYRQAPTTAIVASCAGLLVLATLLFGERRRRHHGSDGPLSPGAGEEAQPGDGPPMSGWEADLSDLTSAARDPRNLHRPFD